MAQKDIILLQDITQNKKSFGKLFYDKQLDDLCFTNKLNETKTLSQESSSPSYRSHWSSTEIYSTNQIVLYNNHLYTCISPNTNTQPDNSAYWQYLCTQLPIIFFSIYVNESCCFEYDEQIGLSRFAKCLHKNPSESNMYDIFELSVTDDTEHVLPLLYVTKNTPSYFTLEDGDIHITQFGYYRITYNLVFHGTFDIIRTRILVTDTYTGISEYNVYSGNMAKNCTLEHNDISQTINHTFFLAIKQKQYVMSKLEFVMQFKNSNDKIIFIHPVETWISIERIGNHN